MKKLPALKRIVVTFCEEGEISDEEGGVRVETVKLQEESWKEIEEKNERLIKKR